MRLDKFIAQQLGVSRAIAGREIRGNRVTVDGEIVRNAAFKLLPEHDVAYDGNPLAQQHGPRYFMLNKPQGYVCSTDDPDHPTVLYFLDEPVSVQKLNAHILLDTLPITLTCPVVEAKVKKEAKARLRLDHWLVCSTCRYRS